MKQPPMSDEYYEEQFEFPLWKMIKERAEKKNISYTQAQKECLPEYIKAQKLRYRDEDYENKVVTKRWTELRSLSSTDENVLFDKGKKGE